MHFIVDSNASIIHKDINNNASKEHTMRIVYGIESLVLCNNVTYWFITINGQIPSSATRYKTKAGAERAAKRRIA
jgi:hypothetical protein